jgi:hypothetical protein
MKIKATISDVIQAVTFNATDEQIKMANLMDELFSHCKQDEVQVICGGNNLWVIVDPLIMANNTDWNKVAEFKWNDATNTIDFSFKDTDFCFVNGNAGLIFCEYTGDTYEASDYPDDYWKGSYFKIKSYFLNSFPEAFKASQQGIEL